MQEEEIIQTLNLQEVEVEPKKTKKIVKKEIQETKEDEDNDCLLYTSPSPRDRQKSRMPSSA